ncbi:hypothetical protein OROGR_005632 [Orobanche gracilis]
MAVCLSRPIFGNFFYSIACGLNNVHVAVLMNSAQREFMLTMQKVLDCGVRRNTGSKSASLFLLKRLGRSANGFEYGALEVKDHLESLIFSEVVSEVKICFSRKMNSSTIVSPWACHFHINKEVARRRRLKSRSIIDSLHRNTKLTGVKSKIYLPKLHITSNFCSESDTHQKSDSVICISVALIESLKGFSDLVKPVLLQTVIKGFPEFKKVEILWKDGSNDSTSIRRPSGQLFLRVIMSECCDRTKFWSILVNNSLGVRNIIDWDHSHPDDIADCSEVYGIDVAWQRFVKDLHSAIEDTGKTILPEHLVVTANCLSTTGQFVPLSAKGMAHQQKESNICSPFTQACFSNPSDCLVKAAKTGQKDGLQGSLEALAWGQTPSIGTGSHSDILYNGKGHEPAKSTDIYSLLRTHVGRAKPNDPMKQILGESIVSSHFSTSRKSLLKKMVSQHFSEVGIQKISQRLKRMLKDALVGRYPCYKETCFFLVRTDGTEEDFSYNKCIHHALEIIAPEKANAYHPSKKENAAHAPAVMVRFSGSGNGKAFKGYPFSYN